MFVLATMVFKVVTVRVVSSNLTSLSQVSYREWFGNYYLLKFLDIFFGYFVKYQKENH